MHPRVPPDERIPWQEFTFAIGLQAVHRLMILSRKCDKVSAICAGLERTCNLILNRHAWLYRSIMTYWGQAENRKSLAWEGRPALNAAAWATSILPDGYLNIVPPDTNRFW